MPQVAAGPRAPSSQGEPWRHAGRRNLIASRAAPVLPAGCEQRREALANALGICQTLAIRSQGLRRESRERLTDSQRRTREGPPLFQWGASCIPRLSYIFATLITWSCCHRDRLAARPQSLPVSQPTPAATQPTNTTPRTASCTGSPRDSLDTTATTPAATPMTTTNVHVDIRFMFRSMTPCSVCGRRTLPPLRTVRPAPASSRPPATRTAPAAPWGRVPV